MRFLHVYKHSLNVVSQLTGRLKSFHTLDDRKINITYSTLLIDPNLHKKLDTMHAVKQRYEMDG